jgi:serine/threonine protein kinase
VKLAKDSTGKRYALKIMKSTPEKAKSKDFDMFYNEINSLKKMEHKNILKLHKYSDKEKAIKKDGSTINVAYIALEYSENGELFDYVAETGKFSDQEARYFYHQIIDALEYIHGQGYAHRDIKPENILLDENFNVKLADFGFATKDSICHTRKGTFGYMAPEVLANEDYNGQQEDLFSAAVILFILLTQHPPFIRAEPNDKYYKKIIKGKWDQFWDVHADMKFPDSFIDFFSKSISPDPKERLTLAQIKEHEWYNGPVATQQDIIKKFSERKLKLTPYQSNKDDTKDTKGRAKSSKANKKSRKYTNFLMVKDGDVLVDAVIEYAKEKDIRFDKSKDYFRVELSVEGNPTNTRMQVNVLKKPDQEKRCLEFICKEGEKSAFEATFSSFKKWMNKKFQ